MTASKELSSRVKDFFRYSKQEIGPLVAAVLLTAFIFVFRQEGDYFSIPLAFTQFIQMVVITSVSFFIRISCQKIYGLSQGYKIQFKVWWAGLVIALIIAFVTAGRVPLVLIGAAVSSLMVKQRLGEFRYGTSGSDQAVVRMWGIHANLILAILFATGALFFPGSYFFTKGLWLNIIMAACSLIPIPQLGGARIFFGSRMYYYVSLAEVLLGSVLLLTGTRIGLIFSVLVGAGVAIFFILIG